MSKAACSVVAENKAPVLLGETMADRVEPVARRIGCATFNPTSTNPALWMTNQRRWIKKQIRSGRTIYDIGIDAARPRRSAFYSVEIAALREAGYARVFRQWVTGDNGRRFRLYEWVRPQ